MTVLTLYFATVIIWGSTWLAIKFQLGDVADEVSILYRFLIASITLLIFARIKGLPLRYSIKKHLRMFCLGIFLFSTNYLFFYKATHVLTTGLIAVVFASAPILNIMNEFLLLRKKPNLLIGLGALCGLTGVFILFLPEMGDTNIYNETIQGILLALGGTLSFSFGNLVSASNQKSNLPIIPSTGYSMLYGCVLMFVFILYQKISITFNTSPLYWGSLLYLALPGSVIAFVCYLSLVGKIGAPRSAYVSVLFPVVALTLSTVFENFIWSSSAFIGVALIILGNMIILPKTTYAKRPNVARSNSDPILARNHSSAD